MWGGLFDTAGFTGSILLKEAQEGVNAMLKSALDLLTDPAELADLLEAYGLECTSDAAAAKRQLRDLEAQLGPDAILANLVRMAGSFALMAEEIFTFCEEVGAGIRGQIQLKASERVLPSAALDSSWAWTGAALGTDDIEERSQALVARLTGIAEVLDPERLVQSRTEERETSLGPALRHSPDPQYRALYRSMGKRTNTFEVFSEADRRSLTAALEALAAARAKLNRIPLPAGVKITFDEIDARCHEALDAMRRAHPEGEGTHQVLTSLSEEIQLVAARLHALAADAAEAERAEAGFGDFLKTDFWFQRWRVYEIWLLVSLLRSLKNLGGQIVLHRVSEGTWTLRYGRDREPVATCEMGGRLLEAWYQLFAEGEERADMPDLALLERGCPAVAVIDPKHGRSYTYGRVDEVLRRYDGKFRAALTAIVNYFPMAAYPFRIDEIGGRRLILASEVAPGAAARRRLDLHLEDVVLARGFAVRPVASGTKAPAIASGKRLADRGVLVYQADRRIEVDQPQGPWLSWERGTETFPELAELLAGTTSLEEIDAAPGGQACILRTQQVWFLWTATGVVRHPPPADVLRLLGWNRQGTLYAALTSSALDLWESSGRQREILIEDPSRLRCAGWDDSGEAVVFDRPYYDQDRECERVELVRLDLAGRQTRLYEGVSIRSRHEIVQLGPGRGTLVYSALGEFLLAEGEIRPSEGEVPLAVSPSGRYLLQRGPQSLLANEGVKLLAVREIVGEVQRDLPLVRFYGSLDWDGKIRWSPDEARFAFLVVRVRDGRYDRALLAARPGERYAESVSIPGQNPSLFAWVGTKLMRALRKG